VTPEQTKLIGMFENLRQKFDHAIVGVALAQEYMRQKDYAKVDATLTRIMQGPVRPASATHDAR